jgi:hypothetical protein
MVDDEESETNDCRKGGTNGDDDRLRSFLDDNTHDMVWYGTPHLVVWCTRFDDGFAEEPESLPHNPNKVKRNDSSPDPSRTSRFFGPTNSSIINHVMCVCIDLLRFSFLLVVTTIP